METQPNFPNMTCQNSIFFRYFKIFPDIRSNFFQKQPWIHPETHKTLINLSYQNTTHLSKYSTFGKPLYSEFLLTAILWFIYYFCLGKILRSFIWLQPFQTKYNPRRQNFVWIFKHFQGVFVICLISPKNLKTKNKH